MFQTSHVRGNLKLPSCRHIYVYVLSTCNYKHYFNIIIGTLFLYQICTEIKLVLNYVFLFSALILT